MDVSVNPWSLASGLCTSKLLQERRTRRKAPKRPRQAGAPGRMPAESEGGNVKKRRALAQDLESPTPSTTRTTTQARNARIEAFLPTQPVAGTQPQDTLSGGAGTPVCSQQQEEEEEELIPATPMDGVIGSAIGSAIGADGVTGGTTGIRDGIIRDGVIRDGDSRFAVTVPSVLVPIMSSLSHCEPSQSPPLGFPSFRTPLAARADRTVTDTDRTVTDTGRTVTDTDRTVSRQHTPIGDSGDSGVVTVNSESGAVLCGALFYPPIYPPCIPP
ncbi:MAG: hypothetical protein MHM6MM_007044 [Cercozoa sp. M6MM]